MDIRDIQRLKAFFFALKENNYQPRKISSSIVMNGELTPIDKPRCLELLRSFPVLEGKSDDQIFEALADPKKIKNILGQLPQSSERTEFEQILEEKPVVVETAGEQSSGQTTSAEQAPVGGEQAGTMSGGPSGFGLPSLGTAAVSNAGRRTIYRVPRVAKPEEPTSKLYVANKSGNIVQERTITPTSVKIEKPVTPSRLVIADKSGNIVGEKSLTGEKIKLPESKIYIANKSGAVVGERTIPNPKGFNIRGFRMPYAFSNFGKNVIHKMSMFLNRNIIPIARTGLGAFAGGVLTAGNPLGMLAGGVGGATWNAWGMKALNGTITAGTRLSNIVGRGGLGGFGTGRKVALAFLLFGFLVFGVLISSIIPGDTSTPTDIAAPISGSGDISSCKFTRAGIPYSIKSSTLQNWIVSAANTAGIAPSVLASVVMHESASFVANAVDSDDSIKNNYYCTKANVFCEKSGHVLHSKEGLDDPCTPEEVVDGARNAQAVGLGQNIDIYNPGRDLCSITESLTISAAKLKRDGVTSTPNQTQINSAILSYFNHCDYGRYSYCDEVWADVQSCQQTAPLTPTAGTAASCPVPGGHLTTHSYQEDPAKGHCSPGYPLEGICRTDCPGGIGGSRRAHAIDVPTRGQDVILPTIDGQSVRWKFKNAYSIDLIDGGGSGFTFETVPDPNASPGTDVWTFDMLHMATTGLNLNGIYPSGTAVGKTAINHVHFTLGKNIKDNMHPGKNSTVTDCDPGWLASDSMCR